MTRKLVIIGAGMASGRVIDHLTDTAPGTFDITLVNAEPRGNYNRIMLSPVLSGNGNWVFGRIKNGMSSVVPRMWGGITNPRELRANADAAEKNDIPAVKVTGGQRIDLLGVTGDDPRHPLHRRPSPRVVHAGDPGRMIAS